MRGLRTYLRDDELLLTIEPATTSAQEDDLAALSAILSTRRIAMLRYAVKLSGHSSAVAQSDLAALREHDFSDTDILQLAELVGYFAYANRIANGLGVLLESTD